MTIALIDDHPILLKAVKSLLASELTDYELVEFSNPLDFLESTETTSYDLVITDISMPQMKGSELIAALRNKNAEQKILVLSTHKNERIVQNLFGQKINGYVFKDDAAEQILDATKSILETGMYMNDEIEKMLNQTGSDAEKRLTQREIEIVQLIAKGFLNKEIADKCFISEATVKTHRKNIMFKLALGNTADLVRYAVENELA